MLPRRCQEKRRGRSRGLGDLARPPLCWGLGWSPAHLHLIGLFIHGLNCSSRSEGSQEVTGIAPWRLAGEGDRRGHGATKGAV